MCNSVLADELVPYEVVVQNYEAYEGHVWDQGSKWADFVSPDIAYRVISYRVLMKTSFWASRGVRTLKKHMYPEKGPENPNLQ